MSENVSCQSTKEMAFNCIENLLLLEEITVDKYNILRKTVEMFGIDNIIYLGDGIVIKLVDEIQE